ADAGDRLAERHGVLHTGRVGVQSIALGSNSSTNAASVQYTLPFSEAVTGVGTGDFALTATGSRRRGRSTAVTRRGRVSAGTRVRAGATARCAWRGEPRPPSRPLRATPCPPRVSPPVRPT